VTITAPLELEEFLAIAGGGERSVDERHLAEDTVGLEGRQHLDGETSRLCAECSKSATSQAEKCRLPHSCVEQRAAGRVECHSFADGAEIDAHSAAPEEHRSGVGVELDVLPTDFLPCSLESDFRWQGALPSEESPHFDEGSDRDVEGSVADTTHLQAVLEQEEHLGVDGDGRRGRAVVDARYLARRAIVAQVAFDPFDLCESEVEDLSCFAGVRRRDENLSGRPHGWTPFAKELALFDLHSGILSAYRRDRMLL
jgi:hypothetical protein